MPCFICGATRRAFVNGESDVRLHVFPLSRPKILKAWKKFARVPPDADVTRLMLCTKHFKEEDIISGPLKTFLSKTAIPRLFLPEGPGEDVAESPPSSPDSTAASATNDEEQENYVLFGLPKTSVDSGISLYGPVNYIVNEGTNEVWAEYRIEEKQQPDHTDQPDQPDRSDQPDQLDQLDQPSELEEPCKPDALQIVREKLCRLCSKREPHLVPIFELPGTTQGVSLAEKIQRYLSIKVTVRDKLPLHICSRCLHKLQNWHEFHVSCLSADTALRKVFCDTEDAGNLFSASAANINDSDEDEFNERLNSETSRNEETHIDDPMSGVEEFEVHHENRETVKLFGSEDTSDVALEGEKSTIFAKPFLPKCTHCNEYFHFTDEYKEHLEKCQELPVLCDVCGVMLPHRKYICKHKRKHVKKRIFICDKCPKRMTSIRSFQYHTQYVHDKKPPEYYCESCCKVIYTKFHYQVHMSKHEADEIKSTKFTFQGFLQDDNNVVYICPVCEVVFGDKLSLIIHLTTVKLIKCPSCQKETQSEKKFLLHKCSKWFCSDCSISFSNLQEFDEHMFLHKEIAVNLHNDIANEEVVL